MPYQIAADISGPLAQLADGLALPASLQLNSKEDHRIWAFVDKDLPEGRQDAFAILPAGSALPAKYIPQYDRIEDWIPGMTVLFERRTTVKATATAEVSALWTSVAAPLKVALVGDIGLDLDLGIQTKAQWEAEGDCWWSVERPTEAPVLRMRLSSARIAARAIQVTATAHAGLDQATRNAVSALLGQHRTQLLEQLKQGAAGVLQKLPAPIEEVQSFLEQWLALPAATQAAQWLNPATPMLAALKDALTNSASIAVDAGMKQADQLTARLEYAAGRTMERKLEASLTALFNKMESTTTILDADFDFSADGVKDLFDLALEGNLTPLLETAVPGVTLRRCAATDDCTRRQTFSWRLPFASGSVENSQRLQTAMTALDDASGRIVRGYAKADAERTTRHQASLLSVEGTFARHLGGAITVHDEESLQARFEMEIRTVRPLSLQPLMDLYGAGPALPNGRILKMAVTMAPETMAKWLEPQDTLEVSRRMQRAWRTLLPAAIDMDELDDRAAAPLLVWASLPVSTAARVSDFGLELNRRDDTYWDWADLELRQAMVWHPQTRSALEARLTQTHITSTADELRRVLATPVGAAVFRSLLCAEAQFIEYLTSQLAKCAGQTNSPAEAMRNMSGLLSGLTTAFHQKVTSVYGPEAARALGPLLLTAASAEKPVVEVNWSR